MEPSPQAPQIPAHPPSFSDFLAPTGYGDAAAQAQPLANFDFASMDPASQAAILQHYGQAMAFPGEEGAAERADNEMDISDVLDEGIDIARQRSIIKDTDAAATNFDEAWSQAEEEELVRMITDDSYRRTTVANVGNKWASIAKHFSRTVRAVKWKYDALNSSHNGQQQDAAAPARNETGAPTSLDEAQPGQEHLLAGAAMYLGMEYQGMTEEEAAAAAAAAAMQHTTQGFTPEQVAAYVAQYHQYYGDPNAAAVASTGRHTEGIDMNANGSGMHNNGLLQLGTMASRPVALQGAVGAGTTTNPKNDRVFWKVEEQHELLRLVQDTAYRQQMLGASDVNWDLIAKHLGRGKRSVQRKYDNLKGAMQPGPDGTIQLILPANDGKKWSPPEVEELVKLVEDPAYLLQRLGIDKPDWRVLGRHFGRSYESVSYKYSYVKNTGRTGAEGKPKHAKAKHETSYKEMAIWALQRIGGEGTSGQICKAIAENQQYSPQLDTAIVSGKKTLQRWKHGVRSALNAFDMFEKTQRVLQGEVVWRLLEIEGAQDAAGQRDKSLRHRRTSTSMQRRKPRTPLSEGGEALEEAAAQAALAQMAKGRSNGSKKRKADESGFGTDHEALHANGGPAGTAMATAQMDQSHVEYLAQAQMPLLQRILDPNSDVTHDQLSLLPPEQLHVLQQQVLDAQQQQQLPVFPLVLQSGAAAQDGQQGEHAAEHDQLAAEHAAQQAQAHAFVQAYAHMDPATAAQYDPSLYAHDPALQQALLEQQHYAAAAAAAQEVAAQDPAAAAAALAAQHAQLAEHYAEQYGLDPATAAAAAHGGHIVQGAPVGGYDHYAQGLDLPQYNQQYFHQYPYDPSAYHSADQYTQQQMAAYNASSQIQPPPQ